jgi:hypothetical protein
MESEPDRNTSKNLWRLENNSSFGKGHNQIQEKEEVIKREVGRDPYLFFISGHTLGHTFCVLGHKRPILRDIDFINFDS